MVFQRKETTLAHGQVPTYLFRQIPIDDLVKWRGTSGVGIAIDSICSSMVINAWTAFEVLAEDLWVQCLNARPRLGFIAMDAEPETNDDPATLEKKRRVEFKYPADLLRIPGFDPMKQMGTVLSNKWGFDRTDGAKEAYLKAFKNCASEIKSIFEHPELRYLAKVRNVYVHNGGKADKEFVQSVREHPRLSAFQENQIIELDGTLVVELVSASIRRSKALIAFVDKWIKNNPH
jgi:hypothetical protein